MATKLNVADLDFDLIKSNLKTYLKSQSEFSDFDFEGAGINILLDILAYNTHYNSFYLNMVANEMFLDSSALRQSAVSHAKLIGYTPRSTTSSLALVNVAITKANSDPTTTLTLPRFSSFSSQSSDGKSYIFLSTDTYVTSNVGNVFQFNDVKIKEGSLASYVFVVDSQTNPKQIFELPDANIDTSTLQVIVQKSSTELSKNTYTLATDSTEVLTTSQVYYLEEGQNGNYRIYFGDDIFGAGLQDGNLVAVSYINSLGDAANGLEVFKLLTPLLAGSISNTTTYVKSAGGSIRELVDDIKFAAPKSFISNNRAVTKYDYITMINKKYPYFDAVNVWGGEEVTPPVYGKVYVAAKPKLGYQVTEVEKQYLITDVIRNFSVMTVTPEFVDVNYNYVMITADVTYDPRQTTMNSGQIQAAIKQSISNFAVDTLNNFQSTFKLSKLLRYIDDTDPSIQSSTADVYIQKRLSPVMGTSETYTLDFKTELRRGATALDRIFSTPAYTQNDFSGIERSIFLEETPESFSGIESVSIVIPGANYTKTPSIVIDGDGTGAAMTAVIVNGKLKNVVITNPGVGYTTAVLSIIPAVNDFPTTTAQITATIQGQTGILRSYYFDGNGVKKILDANAGTIDYVNGKMVLSNFNPIDISEPLKVLKIHSKPNKLDFKSSQSTIISLDPYDTSAITVNIRTV
jgi:hypothetical protein